MHAFSFESCRGLRNGSRAIGTGWVGGRALPGSWRGWCLGLAAVRLRCRTDVTVAPSGDARGHEVVA